MEPLPHLLTTIFLFSPSHSHAFGEAASESGISRGACQESVTTCCKAGQKSCLAGHSAGKGCLSGICRGRKTQNQYSSRLCRESARFHGIAVPPYWFHSYIFEIVTIVVYWFCGRGKRPVPTVNPWRCSLMPQCFGRPFS